MTHASFMRLCKALVLLSAVLAITACEMPTLGPLGRPEGPPTRPAEAPAKPTDLALAAEQAWKDQDYRKSEDLYSRLLGTALTQEERHIALERLAVSAAKLGHTELAGATLKEWSNVDPEAKNKWSWHQARLEVLKASDKKDEAREHLSRLVLTPDTGWSVRKSAGYALFSELNRESKASQALQILYELAKRAPDAQSRAGLESDFLNYTGKLTQANLQRLAAGVSPSLEFEYPYLIVNWEQARRRAEAGGPKGTLAVDYMRALLEQGAWADRTAPRRTLASLTGETGAPTREVVLLLPLTGQHQEVGLKVVRGAKQAQNMLGQAGLDINVQIVNTESPTLAAELAALNPGKVVIGGPLRTDVWKNITANGLAQDRAFFVFMNGLGDATEGRDAWRFFGSPADQVRAVVEFAMNRLGITRFALLYPDEPYGLKLSETFFKTAGELGASVTGMETYPPNEHIKWGESVASLLNIQSREEKFYIAPDPDFEAVFIADGWFQAQLLAPQFFFYDEERLLLMGPQLWSQTLCSNPPQAAELEYFRLAVTPGAWWPDNPSPGARRLFATLTDNATGEPDFWNALGFDFVRFAAKLGPVEPGFDPQDLNRRLARLTMDDWSLAPITWDAQGRSRQDMFVFMPATNGVSPADPELLAQRLEQARKRHVIMQEKLEEELEKKKQEELEKQKSPPELTGGMR